MGLLLTSTTTLLLAVGIVYFGRRKPGYNHFRHTISELGEVSSPVSRRVAYGLFLPIGLLLCAVVMLTDVASVGGLATCLGAGYVVAAFFPCDAGSPLSGSIRQQIHNLGGAIEYVGGAYFLSQLPTGGIDVGQYHYPVLAGIVVAGAGLLSLPTLPVRGLVQRVLEAVLLVSLATAL